MRWALAGLQALQPRWAAPSAAAAALRQEMLHFVAGLHAWSLHALLDTAWRRLQQARPGLLPNHARRPPSPFRRALLRARWPECCRAVGVSPERLATVF